MRLLDSSFKYVPAAQTDVTQTWLRFGYRPTTDAERHARQRTVRGRLRRPALAVAGCRRQCDPQAA
ncbi:MAG: hypothetical protein IT532_14110 [Burkholderiales bacterium]|nr:hypothetical protein [Burkholderiales bacterium]